MGLLGTALTGEITLESQERGTEWEYRARLPELGRRQVIAINKAGDLSACGHAQAGSEPNNIIMAVL